MDDNQYFTTEDLRNYVYLILGVCIMAGALLWIFLFSAGPFGIALLFLGALIFLKTSRNIFFPHKYRKHMKHYGTVIVATSLFVLIFMIVALVGVLFNWGISPSI